ncbi:MAG TPA: ergothioneine biosynthesis protein EgtB [Deltaproteobacteria bacterium]|nr:ergothioneine biosynthesis protein EgtB [Deltaproteobacteria bacterium]
MREPHERHRVPALTGEDYRRVRQDTEALCANLDPEDCVAQSMPDASPTKWHLAHTTWFFETFVLIEYAAGYKCHHPSFGFLFNSYYNGAGERHARPERGLLTRPGLTEIFEYRARVDDHVEALMRAGGADADRECLRTIEIGLHHERQHQELILTDLKHLFSRNAMRPAYRSPLAPGQETADELGWIDVPDGVQVLGHRGDGFHFDNESPAHRVFIEPCQVSDRLISNGEFRQFIEDGGYRDPALWLDLGWATVQRENWQAPLYWQGGPDGYTEFTLAGERELFDAEPVAHVSFLEADAFARWAGARLPTEAEWEVVARDGPLRGNLADSERFHPAVAESREGDAGLRQAYGDLWEWTNSSYSPYPGYRPDPGTLGEYNGKFMCNQFVLRGGSCASSRDHLRPTYRNFFYAPDRWQFSGIRLARESS